MTAKKVKNKVEVLYEPNDTRQGKIYYGGYYGRIIGNGLLAMVYRKHFDSEGQARYFLTYHRCEARCRQVAEKLGIELPKT